MQLHRFLLPLVLVSSVAHATADSLMNLTSQDPPMSSTLSAPHKPTEVESPPGNWNLESQVQAHSVAAEGSPWLGLSMGYDLTQHLQMGARGYLPVAQAVDKSTYALQAYGRYFFQAKDETLRTFLEPDYAINFLNLQMFESMGLAFGVMDRIQKNLSVGVIGGLETAKAVVDSVGLEKSSSYSIYPKISLVASFAL